MFLNKTHSESLLGILSGNVLYFDIASDYIQYNTLLPPIRSTWPRDL